MISIEIIDNGNPRLAAALASIEVQNYLEVEVIILESSAASPKLGGAAKAVPITVIPENLGMLSARDRAHSYAKGDFCLLLDSTRTLRPGALEECLRAITSLDMLILGEGSRGDSIIARLFAEDRAAFHTGTGWEWASRPEVGVMLPRFFRRTVLDRSFRIIREKLTPAQFESVSDGDHQLIYYEASKAGATVGITKNLILDHFEDEDVSEVAAKYYRYGRSRRVLKDHAEYSVLLSPWRTIRSKVKIGLKPRLASWMLYGLKGVPYFAGYYL